MISLNTERSSPSRTVRRVLLDYKSLKACERRFECFARDFRKTVENLQK